MSSSLKDVPKMSGRLISIICGDIGISDAPDGRHQVEPIIEREEVSNWRNRALNESQKEAIESALGSEITVIQGPPGTGKTSTVIELVHQILRDPFARVLVCGASNACIDNILERMIHVVGQPRGKLLRLGPAARTSSKVRDYSLEINVGRFKRGRRTTAQRDEKVKKIQQDSMFDARCVFTTLHSAGTTALADCEKGFDTIIIDEVSQASLPQCLIPLQHCRGAKRLVVVGDPKQLPPTVLCPEPKVKETLEVTLFDLLVRFYGPRIKRLLSVQYRMNEQIARFSASEFYDSDLATAPLVAHQSFFDANVLARPYTPHRIIDTINFIDTTGEDTCAETRDLYSSSTRNDGEAKLVELWTIILKDAGIAQDQIGVITPYNSQAAAIRQRVPDAEVATVDGFQGQEREAIIMSMVRSNVGGELGFIDDARRLNVALTRAKRHLCVIGDVATLTGDGTSTLARWIAALQAQGVRFTRPREVHSVVSAMDRRRREAEAAAEVAELGQNLAHL